MIDVSPLPDLHHSSIYDWGAKVEVRTDKDGKHPYLYALAPMRLVNTETGAKYFSYGVSVSSVIPFLGLHRYLYSIKDIKHFRTAVRLRHMTLEDFINEVGFEKVGYDPETMEDWYICQADEGRLT
jgi:hypothetical protein